MAITEMRPIANKTEKSDNPEFQSRPSDFPEDIRNSRAATQTISTKIRGCSEFGRQSRSDKVEKERDEHFNSIRSMIPMKQERRVKKKTSTPALTTSDDDMDLLDDDEAPLIKDVSPPPTGMDINMVFMLPVEFKGAKGRSLRCFSAPRRLCSRSPRS
jgi:hypothetical protein